MSEALTATTTDDPPRASAAENSAEASPRRPIRDLIEGFGIALLMAVFFKFFAIEAYQIPTSSMQPTMMGSSSAEVYDRLIVDKFRYSMIEPRQWDISVFKYPIREIQNYVKRIVGMPGMKLRITGGNVYAVTSGDGSNAEDLTVQRKPAVLQESLWKEVFPARMTVTGQSQALGDHFSGRPARMWSELGGVLTFDPKSKSTPRLVFSSGGRGLINEVWDGYPTDVAQKIKEKEGATPLAVEQVQDLRFAFSMTPSQTPDSLELSIALERENDTDYTLGLFWQGGKGKLELRIDGKEQRASEPFDLAIPAGGTTSFRIAHHEQLLTLEVDGELTQSLECVEFKLLEPPSLVAPRVEFKNAGKTAFQDIVVERDIHYLPSSRPENLATWRTKIVEVPEGHYMMFGDNTMQSVDSRDWTAITIGVEDGKVVNPKTHPNAKKLVGNMRAMVLDQDPDPDENPVIVSSRDQVAFTDHTGEVHVLEGKVNMTETGGMWGRDGAWFQDEDGTPWQPEQELMQFVPREHLIGRPLVTFWPYWRVGLIR